MRYARYLIWLIGCAACGRSSLDDLEYESSQGGEGGGRAGSAGRGGAAGTPAGVAGRGGAFGQSGSVGEAGSFPSFGGAAGAGQSGSAGTSGAAVGGTPTCELAIGDCASDAEPECAATHPRCAGDAPRAVDVKANDLVLVELARLNDGRVAGTGYFRGQADFGGSTQPIVSSGPDDATETDVFVVMYDATGAATWALGLPQPGTQRPTGIAAAPNGDLVIQAASSDPSQAESPRAFVKRMTADGEDVYQFDFAKGEGEVTPGRVRIDNDGTSWLSGGFQGELSLGAGFSSGIRTGYLFALRADASLESFATVHPDGWLEGGIYHLAVDDEDYITLAGYGKNAAGVVTTFVQKRSNKLELYYEKELSGLLGLTALAVDGRMRLTLAGTFLGQLTTEGGTLAADPPGSFGMWLAQYTRNGELLWQQEIDAGNTAAYATALTADIFGNLVAVGVAQSLSFAGEPVKPDEATASSFLFKLRPSGAKLWAHRTSAYGAPKTVVTDASGEIWLGAQSGTVTRLSP